jgi:hypothetical protein
MAEGDERLPRGPQGKQGEQGVQGAQGRQGDILSPAMRRALIYLFALAVLIGVGNLYWTARAQNSAQAAQRRQGQIVEHKLCTTLSRLIDLKPPAGNPASNPSRGYLQDLHETLSQLGPDLGCR